MSSMDQVSTDLKLLKSKRENILKTLQKHQSYPSLTLQWEEFEELSLSITFLMQTCFRELESKEKEINDRFEVLEARENELKLCVNDMRLTLIDFSSGEKLSLLLNDYENELEKMADGVHNILKMSSDPAKLVLDAITKGLDVMKKGFCLKIERNIVKRSTLILLEQLIKVGPKISRRLRRRAEKLANEWKGIMEEKGEDDVDILGFLMLLGSNELVDKFDLNELRSLLKSVAHHKQAPELRHVLGIVDKSPESSPSQVQIEQVPMEKQQVKLEPYMASSTRSCWPKLKSFCINMDGKGLVLFLCQHVKDHDSMRIAISDALELASDPAKLVLDVLPGFYRSNKYFEGLPLQSVRRSCILLLEQLMTVSPQIEPYLNKEALKFAVDWKIKVALKHSTAVTAYGFLQFIITYKLVSSFDACDLLGFLVRASEHKRSLELCLALGLADKIAILIKNLLENMLMFEAIEYICAFDLLQEFPPESILKGYLNYQKEKIYNNKESKLPQNEAIDREIATLRAVIKFINDHRLESHCSPKEYENQIVQLEKRKTDTKCTVQIEEKKAEEKQTSESSPSQVQVEQARLEKKQVKLEPYMASSSLSYWPELKSFCINMDGKGLVLFLCQHVKDHDSMRIAISDALELASDPAKLVLGVLPGFYRSNKYFEGLSLQNVKRSCILLLEQLMTVSPQIEPYLNEEALKFAVDWKIKVALGHSTAVTAYGFLQFIITYKLVSSFDACDLLGFLVRASEHKRSPEFCLALGLADKISILIKNLLEKMLMFEAIEYICAFELLQEFPPESILKGYLNYQKEKIYNNKESKLPQNEAIDREIATVRAVIEFINDHRLESHCSPKEFENQIVQLEKRKTDTKCTVQIEEKKAEEKQTSESSPSQVQVEQAQLEKKQVKLEPYMASSSLSYWPELKSFCINMDGKGLVLFLCQHVKDHDSMRIAISDALELASDPAKLVLGVLPGFYRSNKYFEGLSLQNVKRSCILLLEQLMTVSPQIEPYLNEEALKFAVDWKIKVALKHSTAVTAYGFLQFIITYKLVSSFDACDLLGFLVRASEHKRSPEFCLALGLADKISILIKNLLENMLMFEAIEYICAFELLQEFPLESILKGYLNYQKEKIYNNKESKLPQNEAIDREIATLRAVIKFINDHRLESHCSPKEFENQIVQLEKRKTGTKCTVQIEEKKAEEKQTSESCPSQVQVEQAQLEKKQVKLEPYMASSSLSYWAELKSFSVNMDGKGLVLFLCQHVKDHDSMRIAISDGLELASDPAKLVLDVLPGFYRSNKYFEGLPLQNVRRSCILLLEQLVTVSPPIEPYLNEEALKFAVDWKIKVALKHSTAMTAYGFLQFIITYKLVSSFDACDLLGFLVRASEHKQSPDLCLALGLADKTAILIKNLLENALILEAIEYICSFELLQEFPPESILNGYLNYQKEKIYNSKESNLPQNEAIDREIATVRAVIKCINDHRLESHCSPNEFEKQIVKLEKRKMGTKCSAHMEEKEAEEKQTSESCPSQVQVEQAQLEKKQVKLEPYMASSSLSYWPELKSFCVNMDGKGLVLFLCQHVKDHDSMRIAISDALELASDPAKLVLDVLRAFFRSNKYFEGLPLPNVRRSCILLLEQLMTVSPQIEPFMSEEALKFAVDWKIKMSLKHSTAVTAYGFLQFIITYKLVSSFDACDLLGFLVRASEHKRSLDLCLALGLEDKIAILVKNLLENKLMLEAIEYICAFELLQEFPPECILKGYLNYQKEKIYNSKESNLPQSEVIDREIATVRTVIKCISDHRLESHCPPKKFEEQIVMLEKRKTDTESTAQKEEMNAAEKQTSESIPSQVQIEQALLEKKQVKLEPYLASSSLSYWLELKSFCVSMDGKGLVLFLSQHVEDHDSMRRAISDALGLVSDPAKLVLDVLPGFHRSKKYFKGLPLQNVRRSCILLLEQLLIVSPQIEPCLSEEALKLAVDWKTKVAEQHPTFVTAYGLLLFVVTYKLVSTSDAYELLGLLVRASEHKQSLDLSLPLGLADKIPILVSYSIICMTREKWIKHYSSGHKILLVGDGDFSFALCLAKAFGSAANMIATSLDSRDEIVTKYSKATTNLKELEEFGCTILHGVDALTMSQHGLLCLKLLDRIVFNFPHAGFILREIDSLQIELHRKVVKGFLRSAKDLLKENGEIHITHKTAHPFNLWEIEKLAEEVGLCLVGKVPFCKQDYPGYNNKKGDGIGSNKSFHVGECSTFKFAKPLFSALVSTVNPS